MNKLTPAQQAWVDALRSGEYRQGRHFLNSSEGFCCLGVACDVAVKHGVEVKVDSYPDGLTYYDCTPSFLPKSVQEWLGMRTPEGHFNAGTVEDAPVGNLYRLNDNWYWTFEQIADAIERAQGLFVEAPEVTASGDVVVLASEESTSVPESEIEF